MSTTTSIARLEARISTDLHVMEDADVMRLSIPDQMVFANALIAPAAPASALVRAFDRCEKLLVSE